MTVLTLQQRLEARAKEDLSRWTDSQLLTLSQLWSLISKKIKIRSGGKDSIDIEMYFHELVKQIVDETVHHRLDAEIKKKTDELLKCVEAVQALEDGS